MEYSGDAFHTFLGLNSVIYLAVNGTVTSLPVFIQNILNCVLKTNKAFTGLERHWGKWKMTIFILGWSIPLISPFAAQLAGASKQCNVSPEVVTAGSQNRFVNLKPLVVNGQNHIQQLTLITQCRQSPQESVAVAGGRESTTERAILVVGHAGRKRESIYEELYLSPLPDHCHWLQNQQNFTSSLMNLLYPESWRFTDRSRFLYWCINMIPVMAPTFKLFHRLDKEPIWIQNT